MTHKLCCQQPVSRRLASVAAALCCFVNVAHARAVQAPAWLHALATLPLPPHDENTSAVLLQSETALIVQPDGRIKRTVRRAYKILRPEGRDRARLRVDFDGQSKVSGLHAWCISADHADVEVVPKDVAESALPGIEGGALVTDIRSLLVVIPGAVPGAIVGYEFEQEQRPYFMEDEWQFQDTAPVRQSQYTLQLPPGWNYSAAWINHSEIQAIAGGSGQWHWTVDDVPPLTLEQNMPPWRGLAARLVVSLIRPGEQGRGLVSWSEIGKWYLTLTRDRRNASPEIQRQVALLTASEPDTLGKIKALSWFVQSDIRYAAIELGIGGQQPHPAADVFTNRYGDCKDKVTLLSTMLQQIGVESYYVLINTVRGTVTPATPANLDFDHAILAIRLPPAIKDQALMATIAHHEKGTLRGEVREIRVGDSAAEARYQLQSASADTDKIKPVEQFVAGSLSSFQIQKAGVANLRALEKPFEWRYSFEAESYARVAGDLLFVRPRVLGIESEGFLETREPRAHPIEFRGPERDTDTFDIVLPRGYNVDQLPRAVDEDNAFASYHSKSQLNGNVLHYTRTLEIRQLSVAASSAEDLKRFYRVIAGDERSTATLKQVSVN